MTTPYRGRSAVQTALETQRHKHEVERRELESVIKRLTEDKASAAQRLIELANDRQGSIVTELRRIAEGLLS